jgi:hypothetical protein
MLLAPWHCLLHAFCTNNESKLRHCSLGVHDWMQTHLWPLPSSNFYGRAVTWRMHPFATMLLHHHHQITKLSHSINAIIIIMLLVGDPSQYTADRQRRHQQKVRATLQQQYHVHCAFQSCSMIIIIIIIKLQVKP